MERFVERLPQKILIESNRVEPNEYGGRPRQQRLSDAPHHLVVRRQALVGKLANVHPVHSYRRNGRRNVGKQSAPDLKSVDLV
jgi:hypothetical protein